MSETHAKRTLNARETHDRLRQALRQCEDERERLERELATAKRLNGHWMDEKTAALMRAEKAEAEAKRWKSRRQATEQKLAYEEQLRGEAQRERDALKCCGNCIWLSRTDGLYVCDEKPTSQGWVTNCVRAYSACLFEPSRWKKR